MCIRRSRDYEDFIQKTFMQPSSPLFPGKPTEISISNPLRDRSATKSFHVSLEMSYLATNDRDDELTETSNDPCLGLDSA